MMLSLISFATKVKFLIFRNIISALATVIQKIKKETFQFLRKFNRKGKEINFHA